MILYDMICTLNFFFKLINKIVSFLKKINKDRFETSED